MKKIIEWKFRPRLVTESELTKLVYNFMVLDHNSRGLEDKFMEQLDMIYGRPSRNAQQNI